jgi:hypothetical protein
VAHRRRVTPVLFRDGEFIGERVTGKLRTTFTADDGRSVVLSSSGLSMFSSTEDEDGTSTFLATCKGQPEELKADGKPLVMDRGIITLATTIDFGDPEDDTDDVFVEEVLLQRGPHPEADSGSTRFCEAVESVLG